MVESAQPWAKLSLKERFLLSWGAGDQEFGRAFREAKWLKRRILASCEACHVHTPGEPHRLPEIDVFVPDGPEADPAYSFLLHLPPGGDAGAGVQPLGRAAAGAGGR